jgi:hypothetical protein
LEPAWKFRWLDISTINFETLGSAAVWLKNQAHVMKHCSDIKQLMVELQIFSSASKSPKQVDPGRVME